MLRTVRSSSSSRRWATPVGHWSHGAPNVQVSNVRLGFSFVARPAVLQHRRGILFATWRAEHTRMAHEPTRLPTRLGTRRGSSAHRVPPSDRLNARAHLASRRESISSSPSVSSDPPSLTHPSACSLTRNNSPRPSPSSPPTPTSRAERGGRICCFRRVIAAMASQPGPKCGTEPAPTLRPLCLVSLGATPLRESSPGRSLGDQQSAD
jgi:hypothetical protein